VKNGLITATIPLDGYTSPVLFSDGALIFSISLPANAVADREVSRLFAGHGLVYSFLPGREFRWPIYRREWQSSSFHFFAEFVGILLHTVARKAITTARLPIQLDLPPNIIVERQKSLVFEFEKFTIQTNPQDKNIFHCFIFLSQDEGTPATKKPRRLVMNRRGSRKGVSRCAKRGSR
jgi:hypothetical protein